MEGDIAEGVLTFVHDCLEVSHLFELLEGRSLPVQSLIHFAPELGPNVGPSREGEPHVAQKAGGGVPAGEKHVQHLVPDPHRVVNGLDELVHKDIAVVLRGCLVGTTEEGFAVSEALLHVLPYEVLHGSDVLFVMLWRAVEDAGSELVLHLELRSVECSGKVEVGSRLWRVSSQQHVCGLAKEELGCRVDGETKKELLEVNGRLSVVGDRIDQMVQVFFESV